MPLEGSLTSTMIFGCFSWTRQQAKQQEASQKYLTYLGMTDGEGKAAQQHFAKYSPIFITGRVGFGGGDDYSSRPGPAHEGPIQ